MEHQELEDLAAPYALSRLNSQERRTFEAHAASCPGCAKLVQEYKATASLLPLAVEQLEPSPALKVRILRAAEAEMKKPAAASVETPRQGWFGSILRGRIARPAPYALAASLASIAVIGLSIWNVQLNLSKNDQEQELAVLRGTTILAIAKGTDPQSAVRGEVVRLETEGRTVLRVRGLPSLPSEETYQMWFIRDGTPTSAGLFQVDSPEIMTEAVIGGDHAKAQVFAVTAEKAGGALLPTGNIVLRATF